MNTIIVGLRLKVCRQGARLSLGGIIILLSVAFRLDKDYASVVIRQYFQRRVDANG